jgi:hypothetical protein
VCSALTSGVGYRCCPHRRGISVDLFCEQVRCPGNDTSIRSVCLKTSNYLTEDANIIAAELGEYGITVNAYAPSVVNTTMGKYSCSDRKKYNFIRHVFLKAEQLHTSFAQLGIAHTSRMVLLIKIFLLI